MNVQAVIAEDGSETAMRARRNSTKLISLAVSRSWQALGKTVFHLAKKTAVPEAGVALMDAWLEVTTASVFDGSKGNCTL